jgi:hypothetical protein
MIPYSEREQKTLVERLFNDIVSTASSRDQYEQQEREAMPRVLPSLQLLLDLDFEQKFASLLRSIYRRLPAL